MTNFRPSRDSNPVILSRATIGPNEPSRPATIKDEKLKVARRYLSVTSMPSQLGIEVTLIQHVIFTGPYSTECSPIVPTTLFCPTVTQKDGWSVSSSSQLSWQMIPCIVALSASNALNQAVMVSFLSQQPAYSPRNSDAWHKNKEVPLSGSLGLFIEVCVNL